MKIACRAGYRVNDDNECEKVQDKKPIATREDSKKKDTDRKQVEAAPAKPQAAGQLYCNTGGCRPVRSGCHLEAFNGKNSANRGSSNGADIEVCN